MVLARSLVCYKGCNSGTARWKRFVGPGWGKGQSFRDLPRHHSPNLHVFTARKLSKPYWVFMEASLHSYYWLTQ